MSEEDIRQAVLRVLSEIRHPQTGRDVVGSGQVQDLSVTDGGDVRFSFQIQADDPKGWVRELRAKVEAIEAVSSLRVNVQLPQSGQASPPDAGDGTSIPGRGPGSVPAPTPKPGILSEGAKVVAVSSGKGGVGKSMVSTNLAAALAAGGRAVGLLDADIYGPNIPMMFGVEGRPSVTGAKGQEMIEPMEAHGVRLMSLGFLLDKEQPAIMRGPLISGILKQFLEQVSWGDLDVMVVDMPPGTGDAQLSLVQTIDLDGVLMVSTPQEVSTGDVRRGIKMFERVNTRVLGLVENMSGLVCPHCDEVIDVFGSGGADRLADEMDLPLLGRVPLDPAVRSAGDEGVPTVLSAPDSGAGQALRQLAEVVAEMLVPAGKT